MNKYERTNEWMYKLYVSNHVAEKKDKTFATKNVPKDIAWCRDTTLLLLLFQGWCTSTWNRHELLINDN